MRTATRAMAMPAASVTLWPASERRPKEWAKSPATSCPAANTKLPARAKPRRLLRVVWMSMEAVQAYRRPRSHLPQHFVALAVAHHGRQFAAHSGQVVGVGDSDAAPAAGN